MLFVDREQSIMSKPRRHVHSLFIILLPATDQSLLLEETLTALVLSLHKSQEVDSGLCP